MPRHLAEIPGALEGRIRNPTFGGEATYAALVAAYDLSPDPLAIVLWCSANLAS